MSFFCGVSTVWRCKVRYNSTLHVYEVMNCVELTCFMKVNMVYGWTVKQQHVCKVGCISQLWKTVPCTFASFMSESDSSSWFMIVSSSCCLQCSVKGWERFHLPFIISDVTGPLNQWLMRCWWRHPETKRRTNNLHTIFCVIKNHMKTSYLLLRQKCFCIRACMWTFKRNIWNNTTDRAWH